MDQKLIFDHFFLHHVLVQADTFFVGRGGRESHSPVSLKIGMHV